MKQKLKYKDNLSSKVGYQNRAESKINKLEDDIAALKMENRLHAVSLKNMKPMMNCNLINCLNLGVFQDSCRVNLF